MEILTQSGSTGASRTARRRRASTPCGLRSGSASQSRSRSMNGSPLTMPRRETLPRGGCKARMTIRIRLGQDGSTWTSAADSRQRRRERRALANGRSTTRRRFRRTKSKFRKARRLRLAWHRCRLSPRQAPGRSSPRRAFRTESTCRRADSTWAAIRFPSLPRFCRRTARSHSTTAPTARAARTGRSATTPRRNGSLAHEPCSRAPRGSFFLPNRRTANATC